MCNCATLQRLIFIFTVTTFKFERWVLTLSFQSSMPPQSCMIQNGQTCTVQSGLPSVESTHHVSCNEYSLARSRWQDCTITMKSRDIKLIFTRSLIPRFTLHKSFDLWAMYFKRIELVKIKNWENKVYLKLLPCHNFGVRYLPKGIFPNGNYSKVQFPKS